MLSRINSPSHQESVIPPPNTLGVLLSLEAAEALQKSTGVLGDEEAVLHRTRKAQNENVHQSKCRRPKKNANVESKEKAMINGCLKSVVSYLRRGEDLERDEDNADRVQRILGLVDERNLECGEQSKAHYKNHMPFYVFVTNRAVTAKPLLCVKIARNYYFFFSL